MFSKALITTVGLAVLATAAPPQKRQAVPGVYMCPRPNFAVEPNVTNADACRWRAAPAGVCKHLQWFDKKGADAAQERHTSFAPDKGYFCTLFDDLKCDKSKPFAKVDKPEGVWDVFAVHKEVFPDSSAQFVSYMCSPTSVDDSLNQAVKSVD